MLGRTLRQWKSAAISEALRYRHEVVIAEHLLAVIASQDREVQDFLGDMHAEVLRHLQEHLLECQEAVEGLTKSQITLSTELDVLLSDFASERRLSASSKISGLALFAKLNQNRNLDSEQSQAVELADPAQYCLPLRDMTESLQELEAPIMVGRNAEVLQVLQSLGSLSVGNVVIVGDHGVGKTTLVRNLMKILSDTPSQEPGSRPRIYMVEAQRLLVGAAHRGQIEERLLALNDALSTRPAGILVIDDFDLLYSGGHFRDVSDLLVMFSAVLETHHIKMLLTATTEMYLDRMAKDQKVSKHFQEVRIPQLSSTLTEKALLAHRSVLEELSGVTISTEAISKVVSISEAHPSSRKQPEAAYALLDYACAHVANNSRKYSAVVTSRAVVAAAEKRYKLTGAKTIPAPLELVKTLKQRIIGQNQAIDSVTSALAVALAGLSDARKPLGSFLFLGPTGVGKTELGNQLAAVLNRPLHRYDMSEFSEKHAVAKLIGAPPGYVGYDAGGQLTSAIRKDPTSVILFDEIEKAHPDLFNALLQVLDYGTLTDSRGEKTDFRKTLIIFTSNVGASEVTKNALGFCSVTSASDSKKHLASVFSPEFQNRLDDIVCFNYLTEEDAAQITELQLKSLIEQLEPRGIQLTVSDSAKSWLVSSGYDRKFGARPLARTIQKHVKTLLAERLLRASAKTTAHLRLDSTGSALTLSSAK